MTESAKTSRTDVYAILPNATEAAVWMYPGSAGWTLPHVSMEEALWIRANANLNRGLQSEFGLPVTTLYCAGYREDAETGVDGVVNVLENHSSQTPEMVDGRWLGRQQIAEQPLAQPHHGPIIDAYLAEVERATVPLLRPPWSQPGWFRDASSWMEAELARLGYDLLEPIEQANSWCLSCILRAATSRGDVYLKEAANFPLFVHEPAVVAGLANLFPDNIPTPLSIDLPRRWLLLEDFGLPLRQNPSGEARSDMLQQFAQVQLAAAERTSELLEIGCIDRRLQTLESQLDGLLVDAGLARSLTAAECDQFQLMAPEIRAMCQELDDIGIPETLNHGDLHLGNVAHHAGKMLFFDWTDACIAHPFLDMISIFDEKDEALRARLRDEYLSLWTDFASPQRLDDAFMLAERLAALHQAVSYQSIMAHLEETPKKAFGDVVPHYVRRVLAHYGKAA